MISPWIAFLAWLPISVYFFRRYSVRVAVLVNFIAGWALLPSASYTPTTAVFPYWILGSCLPSDHFFTKASVTGIACLIGILLVDRPSLGRFQLNFWDLPMLVWCTVPLLSAIANSRAFLPALGSELYQTLAWGVPYLAGRLYFNDTESLGLAAKAFILAGVAYVPLCLMEIVTGPQIYAHLYGYEPYRWIGAQRYVGYRPVGLLEDGNQLGIWMATSALIAIWFWRHRLANAIFGIPIAWISATLLVVTLLCQSGGSIVLLFCLLFFAFVRQSYLPRILAALLLMGIVGAISLRLANTISLRSLIEHNRAAYASARFLKQMKRGSFGWRLSQDEQHVTSTLKEPLLGSGQWDWWKASSSRPWGLWLLAFGMYGMIGLLALECLQLLPVARVLWAPFARGAVEAFELRTVLAAAILMSAIDNLLNGSMILPLLLVIGGLNAPGLALPASVRPTAQRRSPGNWETGSRTSSPPIRQFLAAEHLNTR
jgi:hypothetical protein